MRSTQCDWEEVDLTLLFSSPSLGGLSCLASEVHSWCLFYNVSINQHIMFSCLLGVSCEFQKQVKETQLRFVFQPTEEVYFLIYLEIPELGWLRYMENPGPVHSPHPIPHPPAHSHSHSCSVLWLTFWFCSFSCQALHSIPHSCCWSLQIMGQSWNVCHMSILDSLVMAG